MQQRYTAVHVHSFFALNTTALMKLVYEEYFLLNVKEVHANIIYYRALAGFSATEAEM